MSEPDIETLIWRHLLDNVLCAIPGNANFPIRQFVDQNEIDSLYTLAALPQDAILNMTFQYYAPDRADEDGSPPFTPMRKGNAYLLLNLKKWVTSLVQHARAANEELSDRYWMSLNRTEFNRFLLDDTFYGPTVKEESSQFGSSTYNKPKSSSWEEFNKGIKRDKTQYTKLSKDEDHDNWHQSFCGTALTHQLDHILDPTYVPFSKADKELFALLKGT